MTARSLAAACALAAAAALLGSAPARADAIDGDWCSLDGKRLMSIHGPRIVTPGGKLTRGDYGRHYFSYQVPAGEAGAGATISMFQLSEDTVRITDARDRAAAMQAPGEIWHRCSRTIS